MMNTVVNALDEAAAWFAWASWIALGVTIVLLLPLAAFRQSRGVAVMGLWVASSVFFLSLWVTGAYATIVNWGWVGIILGAILAGVGLALTGIVSCLFAGEWEEFFTLLVLAALGVGTAVFAQYLTKKMEVAV